MYKCHLEKEIKKTSSREIAFFFQELSAPRQICSIERGSFVSCLFLQRLKENLPKERMRLL